MTTSRALTTAREEKKQHILGISRVVWDLVVLPWVLQPAIARRHLGRELPRPAASCVLATAEAMFPLVALASRAVAPSSACRGSRHYPAVEAAAASLSPRCAAWIISHRRRRGSGRGPCGGGGGGEGADGARAGNNGGRQKAKEQVAVLAGLCRGGHLRMAQRFVGNGCEWWPLVDSEEGSCGGGAGIPLWSTRSIGHDPAMEMSTMQSRLGLEDGTDLSDELWSERGIFYIMEQVCKNGHLGVFKWIVSALFPIDDGNKLLLEGYVWIAARNGHLHIIKWLVDTFSFADPHPRSLRLKNGVSGVKAFVESFPHQKHLEKMANCVALANCASADEVIEVCKWLSNRFSIPEVDFLSWSGLPKHHNLIKWALSGDIDRDTLVAWWMFSCSECGDVELGKWFVEEKGIVPQSVDLPSACSGRHDNVVFFEWLFKQVVSTCGVDNTCLLESLHHALANQQEMISQWLENRIIGSTNARPKVSLSQLFLYVGKCKEDWFEWLFTHHSCSCDIDCSQAEVVSVVENSTNTAFHHKLSLTFAVLKKFPLNPAVHHDLLLRLLNKCVKSHVLSHIKEVLSVGEFSLSEIGQCLDLCSSNPLSSKVAKWLTMYYCTGSVDVDEKSLKPTIIKMFIGLISNNMRGCAEWFFNLFGGDVTLPLVVEGAADQLGSQVDLATWKMMLRLFPDINREVTIQFFRKIAAATPLHAQFTMSRLGLTLDDIEHFCNECEDDDEYDPSIPVTLRWVEHKRKTTST